MGGRNRLAPRLWRPGAVLVLAAGMAAALWACSRAPSGPPGQARGAPPATSPRQTLTRLIQSFTRGNVHAMTPLIVPERASDVVLMLTAAQEFLAANEQLCELVRREVGLGLAQTIDQSRWAYFLSVFSRNVELLDEHVQGDQAEVSFLVDGQLPARRALLRRSDGAWRYDPGPGDYQQLAEALRRMARGLRQTIEEIRSGRLSPQVLRDHPQRLVEEVRVRLLPGAKRLPPPPPVPESPHGG